MPCTGSVFPEGFGVVSASCPGFVPAPPGFVPVPSDFVPEPSVFVPSFFGSVVVPDASFEASGSGVVVILSPPPVDDLSSLSTSGPGVLFSCSTLTLFSGLCCSCCEQLRSPSTSASTTRAAIATIAIFFRFSFMLFSSLKLELNHAPEFIYIKGHIVPV